MRKFFQRHHRHVALVTTLAVCVALFFFLRSVGFIAAALNGIQWGAHTAAQSLTAVGEFIFSQKAALVEENKRLQERVTALALDQAEASQLAEDRKALQLLENSQQENNLTLVPAKVISQSDQFGGKVILVNRGTADDIHIGDAVIVERGLYIGTVIATRAHSASIQLVTDPAHMIGISLVNDEQTIGIAHGQGGVLLKLEFIPQTTLIELQTLVLTSGLNSGVPKGLVVGFITDVETDEHNPFQSAHIEPLADLQHLSIVGILTGHHL